MVARTSLTAASTEVSGVAGQSPINSPVAATIVSDVIPRAQTHAAENRALVAVEITSVVFPEPNIHVDRSAHFA